MNEEQHFENKMGCTGQKLKMGRRRYSLMEGKEMAIIRSHMLDGRRFLTEVKDQKANMNASWTTKRRRLEYHICLTDIELGIRRRIDSNEACIVTCAVV